jgi:hypothetical protein
MLCSVPFVHIFLVNIITPIQKGPRTDQLKKYSLQKSHNIKEVLEFAMLSQKLTKIALQKKGNSWVFINHSAVHSEGVSCWC